MPPELAAVAVEDYAVDVDQAIHGNDADLGSAIRGNRVSKLRSHSSEVQDVRLHACGGDQQQDDASHSQGSGRSRLDHRGPGPAKQSADDHRQHQQRYQDPEGAHGCALDLWWQDALVRIDGVPLEGGRRRYFRAPSGQDEQLAAAPDAHGRPPGSALPEPGDARDRPGQRQRDDRRSRDQPQKEVHKTHDSRVYTFACLRPTRRAASHKDKAAQPLGLCHFISVLLAASYADSFFFARALLRVGLSPQESTISSVMT